MEAEEPNDSLLTHPIVNETKKESTNLVPLKRRVRIATKKGKEIISAKPAPTKMELFLAEYVKNDGNATSAAMKVFDVKNKINAANMGSQYLKKAQLANRLFLEKEGITHRRMIKEAIVKMQVSKTPEWWDRLMKMGGYGDFLPQKGPVTKQTVNIMKVQKDLLDDYVDGEYVEESEE